MNPSSKGVSARTAADSPVWACSAGLVFGLALCLLQLSSGVSPWSEFAPVDVGSNVVAAAGLVWALIELRTYWAGAAARRAWIQIAAGMAILAVEDGVGAVFMLDTQELGEMCVSVALWALAVVLIARGLARYAGRRNVATFLWLGLGLQIVFQGVGLAAASGLLSAGASDAMKVANDAGELLASLAFVFALFLAEFAPQRAYAFPVLVSDGAQEPDRGEVIVLGRPRRRPD